MLLLTRRLNEAITIGERAEAKITVMDVVGRKVILGIEAPRKIPVHRQEVYDRIQEERQYLGKK